MRGMKRYLVASAAVVCLSATQAAAIDPIPDPYGYPGFDINIIGGGASFPAVVYREVFDCQFHPLGYGTTVAPGPRTINSQCPSAPFGNSYLPYVWAYYVSTGSGNGKAAIKSNSNGTLSGPSSSIPYTSSVIPNFPYPSGYGYHYSGSDDIWNTKDATDWNTGGASSPQSKFGNLIQLPAVGGAVTIALNGKDGAGNPLVQNGSAVSGSSSSINLTRQAVCGIFSGHVTKWNNALLTAINGGTPMGSGQITVVHRPDGSGTNFLFTNALVSQCRFVFGPNNESDATVVSYAFPWKDTSLPCTGLVYAQGANQVAWPDQFSSVCSVANPNPTGAVFTRAGANGSSALVDLVAGTNGAVGYVSPDYVQPVRPALSGGLPTANLQNEFDVSTNVSGTPAFVAPTLAGTSAALGSITPVFDSTTLGNPLAWSLQGVVPNPVLKDAYPIAGFTWIEMYQCYQTQATNVPVQLVQMLASLYSDTPAGAGIINSNGFIQPPYKWLEYIWAVISDENLRPRGVWEGGACSGKVGAL